MEKRWSFSVNVYSPDARARTEAKIPCVVCANPSLTLSPSLPPSCPLPLPPPISLQGAILDDADQAKADADAVLKIWKDIHLQTFSLDFDDSSDAYASRCDAGGYA